MVSSEKSWASESGLEFVFALNSKLLMRVSEICTTARQARERCERESVRRRCRSGKKEDDEDELIRKLKELFGQ